MTRAWAIGLAGLVAGCGSAYQPSRRDFTASARTAYREHVRGVEPLSPGESPSPRPLTERSGLADYLAYAALKNPSLEAAFNRWKAALAKVPQVEALPDPRFSYQYFISEVETRVGAMRQGATVAQTFPWVGKLELRGSAAAEAARAARHRYEAEKLKLFREVQHAYYEYSYLWRSLDIVKQNIRLVRNMEQVIRARYRAAAASHPALVRAEVEVGKLTDRLESLEDLRGPIVARLNAALNRPAKAELPWPKNPPHEQAVDLTDEQLLDWLAESNPELRALAAEVARRERRVELARKAYFPDVTVGVNYVNVADPVGPMSPSDAGKDAVAAMVSLNLPIWWDKLEAGVREARHRRLAALLEKQQRYNSLSADLKLALYRYRDADRKVGLFRDTLVPKARQSLRATQQAFRAGDATFTDMIDAERILLEFQLEAQRALADRAQRLAQLDMLIGRRLPRRAEDADAADAGANGSGPAPATRNPKDTP